MSETALPAKKSWFALRNAADSLEIDILDVIGLWGITAKDFLDQVKASEGFSRVKLRLDSPGGDVIEGFTIYDGLRALNVPVDVEIVGTAASMASVIMLAGDSVKIAENGRVMIHRVTSGAAGNADELDAAAKITKQFEDRIVGIYAAHTGNSEEQIREWMSTQTGTWFIGEEAVAAGFADDVMKKKKATAFRNEWAPMFTMLPAALFDTSSAVMAAPISPETPSDPVEPTAPAIETPNAPETEVEPTAPEAKGMFDRILAAISGDNAIKAELASVKDTLAARDTEIATLKSQLVEAQAKAVQLDAISAKVAELEAKAKTVGQAAAEVAAAHGLTPEKAADLPPASAADAPTDVLAQFNAITDAAERSKFYRQHAKEIHAARRGSK